MSNCPKCGRPTKPRKVEDYTDPRLPKQVVTYRCRCGNVWATYTDERGHGPEEMS